MHSIKTKIVKIQICKAEQRKFNIILHYSKIIQFYRNLCERSSKNTYRVITLKSQISIWVSANSAYFCFEEAIEGNVSAGNEGVSSNSLDIHPFPALSDSKNKFYPGEDPGTFPADQ